MNNLIIDFETFSTIDLESQGAWVYLENVKDWFLTVKIEEENNAYIYSRTPERFGLITAHVRPIESIFEIFDHGVNTIFAHNANGFDRILWEFLKLPAPKQWVDTMELCAYFNLPKSLNEIAKLLFKEEKLKEGKELIKTYKTPDILYSPEVVHYSIHDVYLTEKLVKYFRSVCKYFFTNELAIMEHTYQMNKSGLIIDADLAKKLLEVIYKKEQETIMAGCNPRSPYQLKKYLEEKYKVKLQNVNKYTLKSLPLDEADSTILYSSRTTTKPRIERLLNSLSADGRLRGFLKYYSAITGRAGSTGFQIHNLPRPSQDILLKPINELTIPDTKHFLRSLILAENDFYLCDYSQIEARLLAFVAQEKELIKAFSEKRDVYKQTAAKLFNKKPEEVTKDERQLGKGVVLGCGYGMGEERFEEYCKNNNIDLKKLGLTARSVIYGYRRMYPNIPGLWRRFQQDFFDESIQNNIFLTAEIIPGIKTRIVTLPTRRRLFYHDVQRDEKNEFTYTSFEISSNPIRKHIYGGLLTENYIQAMARDVCLYAAYELFKAGYNVKFHVHDEIVIDADQIDQTYVKTTMCRLYPDLLDIEIQKTKKYNK